MTGIYRSAEGERRLREAYERILGFWPVPHQQLRIPTREGETFVVASGDPAAPPVVLLHGAVANASTWMGDVPALAEQFRVYAVDLIGEPGFSAPSRPARATEAYALWLDEVFQGLGAARPSLVGISLGGWHALDYAIRRPGRAAKIALLCPGGIGPVRLSFLLRVTMNSLLDGGRPGRRTLAGIGAGKLPPAYLAYMKLLLAEFRARREALPIFSDAQLRSLDMPVLMIVGSRDALLNSAVSRRRLQHAVPHARIIELPEAGHFLTGQTDRLLGFLLEVAA